MLKIAQNTLKKTIFRSSTRESKKKYKKMFLFDFMAVFKKKKQKTQKPRRKLTKSKKKLKIVRKGVKIGWSRYETII